MRTTTFILSLLLCINYATAQVGNTVAEATEITDGNSITINNAFTGLTASQLVPYCFGNAVSPKIDLYYYNLIDANHDQINISMATTLGVAARIHFQIIRAVGGDESNLVEVVCDFYDINVITPTTGGEMSFELPNGTYPNGVVNNTDKYYLRIFEPTDQLDLGLSQVVINDILENTQVNMTSADSSTLSIVKNVDNAIKLKYYNEFIKLINNNIYKNYEIYSIDGKLIQEKINTNFVEKINVSYLNKGMYILKLNSNDRYKTIKFNK